MAVFDPIPWVFYDFGSTRFWIHYGLVIVGFVLCIITAVVQWKSPAPYGKHQAQEVNWGFMIPQRLAHIISDGLPGLGLFALVFFLYGDVRGYANYTFFGLFLVHYFHRGLIHPLIMRYRSFRMPLGVALGGFFPNCLYHFINADFVSSASYKWNYYIDTRFILGIIIFIVGFVINRWADWHLRSLRSMDSYNEGSQEYLIPYGGLYEFISCPNYFGELIQWIGWALATWSLAGLLWCLFTAATFFPRSRHNHLWYKQQFELYPPDRRALIPWLF